MEIKNLRLNSRLKKILATAVAAGITLTSTGCGFEGKKNDDAANSPIGYIDEQTLPANETTLSSVSSSIETTTTLKPFDKNSGRIKHFDNGTSVVSDYVQTSYEGDLTTTGTTYTTVKGTNVVTEKNNDDTTKSVVENSKPVTTKSSTTVKITTKPTTKTSVDTTKATTKPTTAKTTEKTTKPTTKTTTITTKATTAKPTTTVTTTTTEAVTEPPVTEPVQREYNINDICYDVNAFEYYSDSLLRDALYRNGGFYRGNSWNGSDCYYETRMMLLMLNEGLVSDDVIANVFSGCELNDITSSTLDYIFSFISAEDYYGGYVDFEQYACSSRKDVGRNINDMISLYRNNSFDEYINNINSFGIDGQYRENLLDMMMLYSFDSNHLCNQVDWEDIVDNHLYSLGDRINDLKRVYQK